MLKIAAIGMLCGILFGLRFRVTILVPAHAVASVVPAYFAATTGHWTAGRILMAALAWSLSCQGGYLLGALARSFRPMARG